MNGWFVVMSALYIASTSRLDFREFCGDRYDLGVRRARAVDPGHREPEPLVPHACRRSAPHREDHPGATGAARRGRHDRCSMSMSRILSRPVVVLPAVHEAMDGVRAFALTCRIDGNGIGETPRSTSWTPMKTPVLCDSRPSSVINRFFCLTSKCFAGHDPVWWTSSERGIRCRR